MVDFNVILGRYWLDFCHAIMDYYAKTIILSTSGVLSLAWKGIFNLDLKRVISFLCACRWIEIGLLSHLAYIRESNSTSLHFMNSI